MRSTLTMLGELPNLAAEVFATWDAPNPAPTKSDTNIRSIPGSRPPTRLDVYDALRTDQKGDLHLLHGWAITVDEVSDGELAPIPETSPTWTGVCRYLTETYDWWGRHALADDCTKEISAAHGRLRHLARTPAPPRYHCTQCGAAAHPQPGGQWMLCTEGHQMPGVGAVRASLRKAKPMTAQAIEREWGDALGLRAKTITEWARRGLVEQHARVCIDRKWRPTYHPWDVIQVMYRHDTQEATA